MMVMTMMSMATMTRPVTMELAERTDPPQKWKSSLFLLKLTCMIIVIVIIKLNYVIIFIIIIKLTCMISIVLFISIIVFLIIIIFFVFIIFFVIIVPILTCQGIL